jgi:hypothetical protein
MDAARSASLLIGALALYVAAGAVVAFLFALFGVSRVLSPPRRASVGARILFLPGAIALWPVIGWRMFRAQASP